MTRWRLVTHALDRTGPPMLALAATRWIDEHRPDIDVDVVSFRGGDLAETFAGRGGLEVVLDDHEPWDHGRPDPARAAELSQRLDRLGPVDATLLVSIAGAQVLPLCSTWRGPTVAWVVEQGEDLHWLDPPLRASELVDAWIAGSATTAAELESRLGGDAGVDVAVEFVDAPGPVAPTVGDSLRAGLGIDPDAPLVMGAGIGTWRKAPDLFVELAATAARHPAGRGATFVWVGGETDPLVPRLRHDVERLGLERVHFVDNTPALDGWLAAADVFAHPARLDSFPLVCLHAAAAAVPVVAFSGVGGVPEMFGSAFEGVPFPDVAGLAGEVIRLIASPDDRREVAEAQRRRVEGRYLTDVAAPRLVTCVEAATRRVGGRG